jgi:PIN domain nuclease of toxin-antitoxin system
MRYMIDTNIFVFLVTDLSQLDKDVKGIIQDYSNTLHMSADFHITRNKV